MNTQAVSPERREMARKNGASIHALVLRRLAQFTQVRAAACMGMDPSALSRLKGDDLDQFCHLLGALGLQVSASDVVVVSRDDIRALERMAYKYLQSKIEHDDED